MCIFECMCLCICIGSIDFFCVYAVQGGCCSRPDARDLRSTAIFELQPMPSDARARHLVPGLHDLPRHPFLFSIALEDPKQKQKVKIRHEEESATIN